MSVVTEYIHQFPEETKAILSNIRTIILEKIPHIEERISYGMPCFSLEGKPFIYFAGFKNHIGLYALPSAHAHFESKLSSYKKGKGSVQFSLKEPIPYELIKEIIDFKLDQGTIV